MVRHENPGNPRDDETAVERFVAPHDHVWEQVRTELAAGRKYTHWMWWIFPQLADLGRSRMSREWGLTGLADAHAYASHHILGTRLTHACELLLALPDGTEIIDVLGPVDAVKLRSSMTLFEATGTSDVFGRVIDRYYGGTRDDLTLDILTRTP